MSKFLTAVLAALFAAVTVTPVAFAQEKKDAPKAEAKKDEKAKLTEAEKKAEAKKKADAVANACKDKKPGEEVTVNGEKVKCPAPKKEAKKDEAKKDEKKGEAKKDEKKDEKK